MNSFEKSWQRGLLREVVKDWERKPGAGLGRRESLGRTKEGQRYRADIQTNSRENSRTGIMSHVLYIDWD